MHVPIAYVDNSIYDAGIPEDYPAEGYNSESDSPLPKIPVTKSDTVSTKGMVIKWFESLNTLILGF